MSYLRYWLNPGQAERAARKAAKLLRPLDFDTIACRGISGALIAAPLGLRLKKNLFVVRKGETTHGDPQEFIAPVRSYVIVDDFIDSGATLDAIIDGVELKYPTPRAANKSGARQTTGSA